MNDFNFSTSIKFYFGKNAMNELAGLVKPHTNKVMLVYGGASAKSNGAYAAVTDKLTEAGIAYVDFGGNRIPSYQQALKAIDICVKENVGCVIGIGGSVCMDMAKVIAFGAKHADEDLWHCFYDVIEYDEDEPHLLVGAIPTYPSGGSEADTAAEIDNEETGQHGSLSGIGPDFSILNPEFSYTLDKEATAYAALTTFVQVSTAYLGGSSPISEKMSESVLEIILDSMRAALDNPEDYDARAGQMWASALCTMGILSCGKDLWGYSIYSEIEVIRQAMGISYRQAITVLFPRWLKAHSASHGEDVRHYLVSVFGVDGSLSVEEAVNEGVQRIIELFESFGLPMTYNAFGKVPSPEQLEEGYARAEEEFSLSKEEIMKMYMECFDKELN